MYQDSEGLAGGIHDTVFTPGHDQGDPGIGPADERRPCPKGHAPDIVTLY